MTSHKDFKRLVRGRMQKTGESYTAARARLLTPKPPSADSPAPAAYARLAGTSDAVLKQRTGCTWERWVTALDRAQAHTWPHPKIAKYVQEKYGVTGWWAQSVTVGYERIKGLRAIGQRRDGSYEANKSRTFPVPLARLYAAFSNARLRSRWIPGVALRVRSATAGKYMRIIWPDQTSVAVGFLPRGVGKSQVAIQHGKLPDRAAATRMKEYWAERLDALKQVLAPGRGAGQRDRV